MKQIDLDKLTRSFRERRKEADPKARQVLDEFLRLARDLPGDSKLWNEIASLDQSWRDTLSDSEVIKYLRALYPNRAVRKSRS